MFEFGKQKRNPLEREEEKRTKQSRQQERKNG
jgi:hypothetical protein